MPAIGMNNSDASTVEARESALQKRVAVQIRKVAYFQMMRLEALSA